MAVVTTKKKIWDSFWELLFPVLGTKIGTWNFRVRLTTLLLTPGLSCSYPNPLWDSVNLFGHLGHMKPLPQIWSPAWTVPSRATLRGVFIPGGRSRTAVPHCTCIVYIADLWELSISYPPWKEPHVSSWSSNEFGATGTQWHEWRLRVAGLFI